MDMNKVKTQKTSDRSALGVLKAGTTPSLSGRKPVHVAMFSGGASSAYVAYHIVQKYGKRTVYSFSLIHFGKISITIDSWMK